MTADCSLLCSLQLWTLKYAGLHERDISVHSYQHKPPSSKQSILPFVHSSSNASSNKDKKATYYDEFSDYFTSRLLPFQLSNKIFHNLRDKLTDVDHLLSSLKLIRTLWLSPDVVFLAFSNGTFVFLYIDKIHRTLRNISIDKTTLTKKFHITHPIADLYLNAYGLYVIYESLSKIDIFRFNKRIRAFDSHFNLANESIRTVTEELPPYSSTIPVRRWFHINHEAGTFTVWWSMLSEGLAINGHLMEGDQRKSRFNTLSIVFSLQNDYDKEKMYSVQTETPNPFYCSSTPAGLTTVEMNEHAERRYDLSIYYYEAFRSVPLRLVHIPSLSSSIAHVIRSSSHTIVCLSDATLISIDEVNHVQRSKLAVLTRNLSGLWWMIDNLLFALADQYGSIVFYDIALNPIWPVLSSYERLNFQHGLKMDQFIVSINALLGTSASTNRTLLLHFSQGGPLGLLDLRLPLENIHSLLRFYLNSRNYSYLTDLFWCLDWTRDDGNCRLALSFIAQEFFCHLNHEEYFHLEQILRTFYAPIRPISDASILRNRSFVNQIAMKFFYLLLRGKFYSKALQLAHHLDNRSAYLDLYYACDHDQEKTIMNACAHKLSPQDTGDDDDDDDDDESGLSVTSSEDEIDNHSRMKNQVPHVDPIQYGDMNEILTSAIEHYHLDEHLHAFLSQRLHAL